MFFGAENEKENEIRSASSRAVCLAEASNEIAADRCSQNVKHFDFRRIVYEYAVYAT